MQLTHFILKRRVRRYLGLIQVGLLGFFFSVGISVCIIHIGNMSMHLNADEKEPSGDGYSGDTEWGLRKEKDGILRTPEGPLQGQQGEGAPWWSWGNDDASSLSEFRKWDSSTQSRRGLAFPSPSQPHFFSFFEPWGQDPLPFWGKQGWSQGDPWFGQDLNMFWSMSSSSMLL